MKQLKLTSVSVLTHVMLISRFVVQLFFPTVQVELYVLLFSLRAKKLRQLRLQAQK